MCATRGLIDELASPRLARPRLWPRRKARGARPDLRATKQHFVREVTDAMERTAAASRTLEQIWTSPIALTGPRLRRKDVQEGLTPGHSWVRSTHSGPKDAQCHALVLAPRNDVRARRINHARFRADSYARRVD